MKCQFKKSIGKRWSMRFQYTSAILVDCTNKVQYTVIERRGNCCKDWHVCGVHKNVLQRRADAGYCSITVQPNKAITRLTTNAVNDDTAPAE